MTSVEMEAELLANRASTLHAATATDAAKLDMARQIRAFMAVNGKELEKSNYDLFSELWFVAGQFEPENRVGSMDDPSMHTTGAAFYHDASATKEFFSSKTLTGVADDLKSMLGLAIQQAAKGFGKNLWAVAAIATAGFLFYVFGRKRGWL